MPLSIKTERKKNDVFMVTLQGSIDTDTYMKLESDLKKIIDEHTRGVILDMAGVDYISSIGIRSVINAKKLLEAGQSSFAMVNLQPQIKKVFDVMKLLPMFEIFDDMPEADKYIDEIIKEEMEKPK